jgi:ABC-type Mn2+/Zn2+ transport system ATPase subunit
MGTFDLNEKNFVESFEGNIELNDNWQIGLIVGNSGTGKTTIAKELFNAEYITSFKYENNAVIDDMPKNKTVQEITQAFNSVGFNSVPSWIKPYFVLSNGQKMRVDLANALLSENKLIVFDEFTSVVDRDVAKISSLAIQKSIRKSDKKFIAVSCHFDIQDWLLPDWVFNTNTMEFINLKEVKKKDQILNWRYIQHQIKISGKCLLNTII